MGGWLNGWTLTYLVISLVVTVLLWLDRRRPVNVSWARVVLWVGSAAVFGLVAWSVLACIWFRLIGSERIADFPFCVLSSGFWAMFVVGAFLPLYALLLSWYARQFGARETSRRSVVVSALALGLPGALWVAYGFASPFYDIGHAVHESLTYGTLATSAFWFAIAGPRLLFRQLAAGQLVRQVAA